MSELQLYGSNSIEQRRVGRELRRLATEASLQVAVIEARTEIEAAKIDAIGDIGIRAMHKAALVRRMEQSLAQAVPHGSGDLATIADITGLALASVTARSERRIGR